MRTINGRDLKPNNLLSVDSDYYYKNFHPIVSYLNT